MTARRLSSFRSGDIAEHLGLLLLKGIAAVAEVPRQEDFGSDAIANLLRYSDDGCCYAEDTFVVQLKSASQGEIRYREHELRWLLSQNQPLFIGLVSLAESQISLYSTLYVYPAVLAMSAESATLYLSPSTLPSVIDGYECQPWVGEDNNEVRVWLGEPVVKWTLKDIGDQSWRKVTYENLKQFISLARYERDLHSLGQSAAVSWRTNDAASLTSKFAMAKGLGSEGIQAQVDKCLPHLRALMMQCAFPSDETEQNLLSYILGTIGALREIGANVDSARDIEKLGYVVLSNKQEEFSDSIRP